MSVTKDGKVVDLYFSKNLDDLRTIKALHPGCETEAVKVRCSVPVEPAPTLPKEDEERKLGKWQSRRVRCVETGEEFESAADCSEKLSIQKWNIYKAILRCTTARGMHFEYLD